MKISKMNAIRLLCVIALIFIFITPQYHHDYYSYGYHNYHDHHHNYRH